MLLMPIYILWVDWSTSVHLSSDVLPSITFYTVPVVRFLVSNTCSVRAIYIVMSIEVHSCYRHSIRDVCIPHPWEAIAM